MNFLSSQSKLFAGLLCLMLITVWLRYTTAPAIHADDRRADAADGQLQLAAKSSEAILRW